MFMKRTCTSACRCLELKLMLIYSENSRTSKDSVPSRLRIITQAVVIIHAVPIIPLSTYKKSISINDKHLVTVLYLQGGNIVCTVSPFKDLSCSQFQTQCSLLWQFCPFSPTSSLVPCEKCRIPKT